MDGRLEQELADAQRRVRALEGEIAWRRHEMSAIRSSNSWRMTAPLRLASRLPGFRRLKSILFKWFHQLSPTPAISRSGLFDRRRYLANNPDLTQSGLDPIKHHVQYRARGAHDSGSSFRTLEYFSNYPAATDMNPCERFVHHGAKGARVAVRGTKEVKARDEKNRSKRKATISAYIQCRSNKTALYYSLLSFRDAYPHESVTLVSDCGDDFSKFAEKFNLYYYRSNKNCDPRGKLGKDGAVEYLKRIYEHCTRVASDYVVILEEDVITRRKIRRFPLTDCGGPRINSFSDALNRHLQQINDSISNYGYAMCGGSIFDRKIYIRCYERENLDLDLLASLDERAVQYSDIILTLIFLVNGYSYGVWEEVSECNHPVEGLRIFRDAAFDHNDKRWYGVGFDERLIETVVRQRS